MTWPLAILLIVLAWGLIFFVAALVGARAEAAHTARRGEMYARHHREMERIYADHAQRVEEAYRRRR